MRVMHCFDPVALAWSAAIRHSAAEYAPKAWQHGGIRGRDRTAAVLTQLAVAWRVRRHGMSAIIALYDARNAFGSTDHEKACNMIEEQYNEHEAGYLADLVEWEHFHL